MPERGLSLGPRAGEVWVADRNFCTLGLLGAILARGGFFVLRPARQHVQGELLGQRLIEGPL